jgi:hypothetical protein
LTSTPSGALSDEEGKLSPGTPDQRLLRIGGSTAKDLRTFKEGVYLESASARTIDDLVAQACADRLRLAQGFLDDAERAMRARPPMRRTAVGRYYYAMYQAARAVVFFCTPGDDHEPHSELPKWLPVDFPDADRWKNELKDARLRRNEADYDPYPAADSDFQDAARQLKIEAPALVAEARSYLLAKGCSHV